MSAVLARTGEQIAGTGARTIPLVLSLEWAEVNGSMLQSEHDGHTLFMTMLAAIDREHATPFEQRMPSPTG